MYKKYTKASCEMSSLAANLLILFIAASCLMTQVDSKSELVLGRHINGDQLLIKDVLKTQPTGLTEEPSIHFNYAISQPITYMEFLSEQDVYAPIDLSYDNELVHGTIKEKKYGLAKKFRPFEVLIQIYGLNDTLLSVSPSYILNRNQQFNGILKPIIERNPHETLGLIKYDRNVLEHSDDEYDEEEYDYDIYDEGSFNQKLDKIIEFGRRQHGDDLLYETYQTLENSSEIATNHTVRFYYIDSDFITYVKFIIYDHFLENTLDNYKPPTVQFEKLSPHTFMASVTDQHTKSLFVEMQIYGYKANDKPVAYVSFSTQPDGTANAGHGSVNLFNWLLNTFSTLTLGLIWRQILD